MRRMIIASICAAQFAAAAQPAAAAELHPDRNTATARSGSFAGARVRVPLGGGRERPQVAAALTAMHRSDNGGPVRFASGAELGIGKERAVNLKLGGRPISRLSDAGQEPRHRKLGVSTVGWVAIGVGAAALLYIGGLFLIAENADDRDCDNC